MTVRFIVYAAAPGVSDDEVDDLLMQFVSDEGFNASVEPVGNQDIYRALNIEVDSVIYHRGVEDIEDGLGYIFSQNGIDINIERIEYDFSSETEQSSAE